MQQRLKQRLVGAVVLVALAVIFIPMLLQGPVEREATSIPIEIPPRPQVSAQRPGPLLLPRAEPAAESIVQAEPVPAAGPASAAQPTPPEAAPPTPFREQPAPASRTPSELAAWAVQVGSFGAESNALRLRDSLRAKGYNAYTERVRSEGQTFYRVRVGPVLERAEAERLQQTLAGKESLQGLVVPHP